jgi:hypothetical protein
MLMATRAQAECRQWDVSGRWHFVQSNGMSPEIFLQRSRNTLTGNARFPDPQNPPFSVQGSIDGSLDGDRVELTVYWDSGQVGVYSGRISMSGLIEGTTFDKTDPGARATWTGDRNATCTFDPAEVSNGKPVMALGRVQPTTEPACAQWGLQGGAFAFNQRNGATGAFEFQQQGMTLGGTGWYVLGEDKDFGIARGVLNGRIAGDTIEFTLRWPDGRVGVYSGSISPLGRLQGSTYPQDNPGERTDWNSDGKAVCLARVQPTPAPPAMHLGRAAPRDPSQPMPSICEASVSARARNSPAAPNLERRCAQIQAAANAAPTPTPAPGPLVDRAELDQLAALGHSIASQDAALGSLRRSNADPAYRYGFDVATALFGDPAMGAQGITALGPGQLGIRASLDAVGQAGFDDSKSYHFSRSYGP